MTPDESWLLDMVRYAREAVAECEGLEEADFTADRTRQLAVTHLLMIVGEAAAQVSDEGRARIPEAPWRKIVGMRNRIVHHYFKVEPDVVWRTVREDLAPLITGLERALAEIVAAGP